MRSYNRIGLIDLARLNLARLIRLGSAGLQYRGVE